MAEAPLRLRQLALAVAIATVIAVCLAAGYLRAKGVERDRQALIASDLTAALNGMLTTVQNQREAILPLVGQPCPAVFRTLSALGPYVPYTRAVVLVKRGRLYCSSALGPIDASIDVYLHPSKAPLQISLLPQTPFHANAPVMVLFDRQGNDGILYLVGGVYLADLLAHGLAYGAGTTELAVAGYGTLSDQGKFASQQSSLTKHAVAVASTAWPFSIASTANPRWSAEQYVTWESIGALIGILLGALLVPGYRSLFARKRSLLRAASLGLRCSQFHLVYQPVVNVATRQWEGVEALIRWKHPRWGEVGPDAFIGEIEESALIAPLTRFVIRTALEELGAQDLPASLHVAVNVAPQHVAHKRFADDIHEMVAASASRFTVVLEVTERGLLSSGDSARNTFSSLHAEGIRFAIDDFGAEHSNIDLLRRFSFDFFKIDRQFVHRAASGDAKLLAGIVSLARHLGATIIAEGVEEEAQHAAIAKIGVGCAQGYLYQKPVPAAELGRLYRAMNGARNRVARDTDVAKEATEEFGWHTVAL
jgi:EAL domain-containing protein (putative c-di-GMP-specific phosphodiesterase class I)